MTRYKTIMYPVVLDNGYIEYTSKTVPLTDEELAEEMQRLSQQGLLCPLFYCYTDNVVTCFF